MTNNEKVIKRIQSAVKSGVKIQFIANGSKISYFRIASVVNTKSYRTSSKFNDEEVCAINTVLNSIEKACKAV